jgi:hypothetical protein
MMWPSPPTLSLTRRSFAEAVVADCVFLGITVPYPLGARITTLSVDAGVTVNPKLSAKRDLVRDQRGELCIRKPARP